MSGQTNREPAVAAEKEAARARLTAAAFVASLMGHPLRNRLAAVRAVLELLEAGLESAISGEQRSLLLAEFDTFVDDFNIGLDMVRAARGETASFPAAEAAEQAVEFLRPAAQRRGIAISLQAGGDGGAMVRASRALLRQALLNLLRNAIQAGEGRSGGAISVAVGRSAGAVWIEVSDNGPGVVEAIRDKLFVDSVTTRPGAAGLGLTLCRDAMILMDGSVEYLTPRGESGARFRLVFPAEAVLSPSQDPF